MSANLQQLVPEFTVKVQELLENCAQRGVIMRPYFTIRDPFTQAKFWRQSRSTEEIRQKIGELKREGADFLAYCLETVGPQNGDPVTNALPGLSWHQWGEAVDCMWLVDNQAQWDPGKQIGGQNGYAVYAEEAVKLGLTAGGLWKSIKDWPHVQLRPADSPLGIYTIPGIDAKMKALYGGAAT